MTPHGFKAFLLAQSLAFCYASLPNNSHPFQSRSAGAVIGFFDWVRIQTKVNPVRL
jgi:hypothetical protein